MAEIGLTVKAFQILSSRKKLVASKLPGGKLFAEPIIDIGVAMIAVSLVALTASMFVTAIRSTHRSKRWSSMSFGLAAFVLLPVLIAETVIGASWHATVTASIPQKIVDTLVAGSGISLYYRTYHVVIGQIAVGWVLFISLVLVSVLERKKFTQENHLQSSISTSREEKVYDGVQDDSF